MAPPVGLEPTTCRLTVGRSTIELQGTNGHAIIIGGPDIYKSFIAN